jgi:tRNA (cmo5U34)-methyltransferase
LNAEERFNEERAGRYDADIHKAISGYEALHGMAGTLLRLDLRKDARVLVVGSGTGAEIVGLGTEEPGWTFTGVDPSEDMTSIARQRIAEAGLAERADLRVGYVHDLSPADRYDAATALLVMHFLPDDGQKLELLRTIASRLKPGAPFVLADLLGEPGSTRFERFFRAWKLYQLSRGREHEHVEDQLRELPQLVHFVPEQRILALLEEAGFVGAERFYAALLFGGWVARKA